MSSNEKLLWVVVVRELAILRNTVVEIRCGEVVVLLFIIIVILIIIMFIMFILNNIRKL